MRSLTVKDYQNEKHSTMDRSRPISVPTAALFHLPIDIFCLIWELLPPQSRACLILTCRHLYTTHHATVLKDLDQNTQASRTMRSYLLRLLRKDMANQSLRLCYKCLKFHTPDQYANEEGYAPCFRPISSHLEVYQPQHPLTAGFPYCNSAYAYALKDVQSWLDNPRDRRACQYREYTRWDCHPVYTTLLDSGKFGVYMYTKMHYSFASNQLVASSGPVMAAPWFAQCIRNTNHEFCEHLRLAHDFEPGDGSMTDKLETLYESFVSENWEALNESQRSPWRVVQLQVDFHCDECRVNIKVVTSGTHILHLNVWQFFGPACGDARPGRIPGVEIKDMEAPKESAEEAKRTPRWRMWLKRGKKSV